MTLVTNQFAPLRSVKIRDGFWSHYQTLAREKILPYQWLALNDAVPNAEPSHALANFRIAAGLEEGEFRGMVFQDSDVAKWLEAVAYRLTTDPDPELEKTADEVIEIIEKAQDEDGYLDTFFQLREPDKKFTNLLECHELYCTGHMVEAAVAYYEATGKDRLLRVMCRMVDLVDSKIGPEEGKLHGYPGHPELELALVKLYRVTGEERYLRLCEYMVNARGTEPHFFDEELKARDYRNFWGGGASRWVDKPYNQSHKPIREQKVAVGHSVRAGYLFTGCADLAAETGDASLKEAMEVLWDNITKKQMYVTGGIGAQVHGEAFSFDYHLPNDTVYNETCAAISMVFFAQRMLQMDVNRKYSDVLERLLYNGTISGMALDGQHFFYTNPLAVWEEATQKAGVVRHIQSKRPGWFGCACCPPNLARMLTSLGNYIYSSDENTVYAHLYIGSEAEFELACGKVKLSQWGVYPWGGTVNFRLGAGHYTLALRIPGWARSFTVHVKGREVHPEIRKGYVYLEEDWAEGSMVVLSLSMPVEFIEANPLARADNGRVAIQRGPIVYCLEAGGNCDVLDSLRIADFSSFHAEPSEGELFEGAWWYIRGKAMKRCAWTNDDLYRPASDAEEEVEVQAIPYAFWGNTSDTREMQVWIRR